VNYTPSIGSFVVVSEAADTPIYKVVDIDGFSVGIIDSTDPRPNQRTQWVDRSMLKCATKQHAQDRRIGGYNVEFIGAKPARAGEDY
jgi:hypothetical protein